MGLEIPFGSCCKKMGLEMPSEGVSIAQEIPLREPVYLLLRRTTLGSASLCLCKIRILRASSVCYSIGESYLGRIGENELLFGRAPGFTVFAEENKTDCYLVDSRLHSDLLGG